MYETREEAAMRLDGTVIQGPSGLVYVKQMESNSRLAYREFKKSGGIMSTVKYAELHEGFNIKPFPLGYLNRWDSCYYIQRMPVRKYKQGLHEAAIRVVPNGAGKLSPRGVFSFLYDGVGFYKMYNDIYPTLEEIKDLLDSGDYISQAFHREWAMGFGDDNKTYRLYYKAHPVGLYDRLSGRVALEENRKYLQEALMEVMV